MKKKIITLEDKKLRLESLEINDLASTELKNLITSLRQTLKATANGVGLAAPQIGVNKRVFVIDQLLANKLNIPDVFINPKIINQSFRKNKLEEGCLSVPEVFGLIKRAKQVKIAALDNLGSQFTLETEGLLAQIVQHEVDHLNGILFIDKALSLFKPGKPGDIKTQIRPAVK